jgi:rRNA maturation endonuclease Nob1
LWIHRRNKLFQLTCPACSRLSPSHYRHCPDCGGALFGASDKGNSNQDSVLAKGH